MSKIIRAVIAWFADTANRRWLYTCVGPAMLLLVGLGYVAPEHVEVWLNLAQALLGLTASVASAVNASAAWRLWLYSVAAAASLALVVFNVIPSTTASLSLAFLAALLSTTQSSVALGHMPKALPPGTQVEDGGH